MNYADPAFGTQNPEKMLNFFDRFIVARSHGGPYQGNRGSTDCDTGR